MSDGDFESWGSVYKQWSLAVQARPELPVSNRVSAFYSVVLGDNVRGSLGKIVKCKLCSKPINANTFLLHITLLHSNHPEVMADKNLFQATNCHRASLNDAVKDPQTPFELFDGFNTENEIMEAGKNICRQSGGLIEFPTFLSTEKQNQSQTPDPLFPDSGIIRPDANGLSTLTHQDFFSAQPKHDSPPTEPAISVPFDIDTLFAHPVPCKNIRTATAPAPEPIPIYVPPPSYSFVPSGVDSSQYLNGSCFKTTVDDTYQTINREASIDIPGQLMPVKRSQPAPVRLTRPPQPQQAYYVEPRSSFTPTRTIFRPQPPLNTYRVISPVRAPQNTLRPVHIPRYALNPVQARPVAADPIYVVNHNNPNTMNFRFNQNPGYYLTGGVASVPYPTRSPQTNHATHHVIGYSNPNYVPQPEPRAFRTAMNYEHVTNYRNDGYYVPHIRPNPPQRNLQLFQAQDGKAYLIQMNESQTPSPNYVRQILPGRPVNNNIIYINSGNTTPSLVRNTDGVYALDSATLRALAPTNLDPMYAYNPHFPPLQ